MKWFQLDQNLVNADLVWSKTFSLLDLKTNLNFVSRWGLLS
jgi:hypothetical protein